MSAGQLRISESKLEREFAGSPKYKKYEARLKAIDKNGDGVVDLSELCDLIEEMATVEKQRRILKWAAIIIGAFALLTIAAVVGLVYAVVVSTKDTSVSSSGILTTKDSAATPIATGQAITWDSTNNLYTKDWTELSGASMLVIPNASGGARFVRISEIDLITNTSVTITTDAGTVYVIDASGMHEKVANQTTGTTSMRKLLETGIQPIIGFESISNIANNEYRQVGKCNTEYVQCMNSCSKGDTACTTKCSEGMTSCLTS